MFDLLEKMMNNPGKSMVAVMLLNLVICAALFTGACYVVKMMFF